MADSCFTQGNGDRNLYLKENFTRTFFRSLSAGGLPWLMARRNAGIGGILSLHRICHPKPYEFASQAGLSVTPENFRRILQTLIGRGYQFLSTSGSEGLPSPRHDSASATCVRCFR
jgi:hypothetical protein